MAIMRWTPFRPLLDFYADVDRLLRSDSSYLGKDLGPVAWLPALDVYESEGDLVVKAELPGMSEKDIEVTLDDGILTIKGERKFEDEIKEEDRYRIERAYGAFYRRVKVTAAVDAEKIDASYADGVLEVRLPRIEENEPKKIEVKTKE